MTFDDLLTKCESDACTGNFISVQTIEHAEYLLSVFRIQANAIVPHGEQPPIACVLGRDVDTGRCFAPVLDRIINKRLENVLQHKLFGYHGR